MITVTAFKWVPPFAQGQVRDFRVRWMLNEANWPYAVRLIDAPTQGSAEYRADQPFGQVPVMVEEGRQPLFESGAIVLDVAMRSGVAWPADETARAQVLAWYFAALNSVEPALQNVAEVEFFLRDEALKQQRRPAVLAFARQRLDELERAIGGRDWLVGDGFTIADLMIASVLKIAGSLDLLDDFPTLAAWQARILDRPAYRTAIEDQCAAFAAHGPKDMRYPHILTS